MNLELDDNGYPTNESLEQIAKYTGSFRELMKDVAILFNVYGRCEYNAQLDTWEVVTGGWSGCESVISAMKMNHIFWAVCWQMSKRGGYYEFKC